MYGIKYAKPNYTSQVVRKQINPILIRTGLGSTFGSNKKENNLRFLDPSRISEKVLLLLYLELSAKILKASRAPLQSPILLEASFASCQKKNMAGYDCVPTRMKRKEIDRVNDDFSDFSLSSPASKIRRLVSLFLFAFVYV